MFNLKAFASGFPFLKLGVGFFNIDNDFQDNNRFFVKYRIEK
jgi:hypothetical protein